MNIRSGTRLRWILTLVALSFGLTGPASAILQDKNDPAFPVSKDGFNILRDTTTGLDWLDLDLSVGWTTAAILNEFGPGGAFEGFHHATIEEVTGAGLGPQKDSLYKSANVPEGWGWSYIGGYPLAKPLVDRIGCFAPCNNHSYSQKNGHFGYVTGVLATDVNQPGVFTHSSLDTFPDVTDTNAFGSSQQSSVPHPMALDGHQPQLGHWLVRDTPPSPPVINVDFFRVVADATHSGADGVLSGPGTFWNAASPATTSFDLATEDGTATVVDVIPTGSGVGWGCDALNCNDLQDTGLGSGGQGDGFEIAELTPGESYDIAIYGGRRSVLKVEHAGGGSYEFCSTLPTYVLPGTVGLDYCLYTNLQPINLGGSVYGFRVTLYGTWPIAGFQLRGPFAVVAAADSDGDGVDDNTDNCIGTPNADQANQDGDALGDTCDPDRDGDGAANASDAFPDNASEATDTDGDGTGNNEDLDDDNDGLTDAFETSIGTNPLFVDTDLDTLHDGDEYFGETSPVLFDTDGDGTNDAVDNCPVTVNPRQSDQDGDGAGDVCDSDSGPDSDNDGVPDAFDNCLAVPNGPRASTGGCNSQEDGDSDGYGNACDGDVNNDGFVGLDDALIVLAALNTANEALDLNCDGFVGLDDVSGGVLSRLNSAPGPSGIACAGMGPCVGP
jgi:hypothetical protein